MQSSGARNIGFTPANLTGNNRDNSGKVVTVNYALANIRLRGSLRIESAFSIFILSAPLCGGEIVRVEIQNVGDILLRKAVITTSGGVVVHKMNNLENITAAGKAVA